MSRFSHIVFAGFAVLGIVACSSKPDTEGRTNTQAQADTTCSHPLCSTGASLDSTCDPCAALLCSQDPYCCTTTWDTTCVGEVTSICQKSCTAQPPPADAGSSACSHALCSPGQALVVGCDPCVTTLCAQDPYCCGTTWDGTCVNEVHSICGQTCGQ